MRFVGFLLAFDFLLLGEQIGYDGFSTVYVTTVVIAVAAS